MDLSRHLTLPELKDVPRLVMAWTLFLWPARLYAENSSPSLSLSAYLFLFFLLPFLQQKKATKNPTKKPKNIFISVFLSGNMKKQHNNQTACYKYIFNKLLDLYRNRLNRRKTVFNKMHILSILVGELIHICRVDTVFIVSIIFDTLLLLVHSIAFPHASECLITLQLFTVEGVYDIESSILVKCWFDVEDHPTDAFLSKSVSIVFFWLPGIKKSIGLTIPCL